LSLRFWGSARISLFELSGTVIIVSNYLAGQRPPTLFVFIFFGELCDLIKTMQGQRAADLHDFPRMQLLTVSDGGGKNGENVFPDGIFRNLRLQNKSGS
jgi:hypothetical protein